jgi:hypothetical protein
MVRLGDRCIPAVRCVVVWLAFIRLVRLVHRGLFRQRVFVLWTRENGQQSYHYDQSRPFLEEVEEAEVREME